MIKERNASPNGIIDAIRELEKINRKIVAVYPFTFYVTGGVKEFQILHDSKELK